MPLSPATKERTIALFWAKVRKTNGCWVWTSGLYWDGYGKFWAGSQGRTVRAHRFSYELHKGKIKKGLLVCHSCDNRLCVKPSHLWTGTVKDNNDDMTTKGRNFFSTSGNPSLKLSNRQVERLRRDRGKGVLLRKLAQKYGVRESTVSRIANGVRRAT